MNNDLHIVIDHPGLFRDPKSKAIVVNDPKARQTYLAQRNTALKALEAEAEVEKLRGEVDELKNLVKELLNKK
jgi:hypothetical protein